MTPEQIAKEAAEAAVTLTIRPDLNGVTHEARFAGVTSIAGDESTATKYYTRWLKTATALALAAAEHALTCCPIPAEVSEGRLEEIRALRAHPGDWGEEVGDRCVDDLFAHIDHLHRVMRGSEADAYAQGYDAGLREGARRQKESHVVPQEEEVNCPLCGR